jgi:hypothetical protein
MPQIAPEIVKQAISILGEEGILDDDLEGRVLALCGEQMLARRLIDLLPEAFALVFVRHLAKVNLPRTFSARNRRGKWVEFELSVEPIFPVAVQLGAEIYHAGPREIFRNIVMRSSIVGAVNKALADGSSLEGATISGPALIGIPAETYLPKTSLWWRLFQ